MVDALVHDAELTDAVQRVPRDKQPRGRDRHPGIFAVLDQLKPGQTARVPLAGDYDSEADRLQVNSIHGTVAIERRWRRAPWRSYEVVDDDGTWWLYLVHEEKK